MSSQSADEEALFALAHADNVVVAPSFAAVVNVIDGDVVADAMHENDESYAY